MGPRRETALQVLDLGFDHFSSPRGSPVLTPEAGTGIRAV